MLNYSDLTGEDFEFLIIHDDALEISTENFDRLMTPDNIKWTKVFKGNWYYYQVGEDEFTYSREPPGIQMTFNSTITYEKAKDIAEQVVEKLQKNCTQEIKLVLQFRL